MRVFLCGGGAGMQTMEANKRLNEVIDHSKPCLYIPLAMEPEKYAGCYEWIKDELKDVDIPYIEMVKSTDELAAKNLNDFGFPVRQEKQLTNLPHWCYSKNENGIEGEESVRGGQRGTRFAGSVLRQAADCTTPEPSGRTGTSAARYSGHERRPVRLPLKNIFRYRA